MIHNKIEQLIKVADALVEGSVNELPKNLTNFKLVLESVKMALETDKMQLAEQDVSLSDAGIAAGTSDSSVGVISSVPKRTRRTKAQMIADAAKAAEELETKVEAAETRIEKAGIELDVPAEKVEAIKTSVTEAIKAKSVNDGEKEDWEDIKPGDLDKIGRIPEVANTPLVSEDVLPWAEDGTELEKVEVTITSLITKYPDPLNLALLENRDEKVKLVADMNEIKRLVGNENTADIKDCLSKLNLDDAITIRAYKFLMVLPHLEIELK